MHTIQQRKFDDCEIFDNCFSFFFAFFCFFSTISLVHFEGPLKMAAREHVGAIEDWEIPIDSVSESKILKLLSMVLRSRFPHIVAPFQASVRPNKQTLSRCVTLSFPLFPLTLFDLIKSSQMGSLQFSIEERLDVALQLIVAVRYLHEMEVFHNHLTSSDLVLEKTEASTDFPNRRFLLKIAHFATANIDSHASLPYTITRNYRPPEVILKYSVDLRAADVWMIGCVLVELFTNEPAFTLMSSLENGVARPLLVSQQMQQIVEAIGTVNASDVPSNYLTKHRDTIMAMRGEWQFLDRMKNSGVFQPSDVELILRCDDLVRSCLQFHPARRVGPSDLLRHELFCQWAEFFNTSNEQYKFDVASTLEDLFPQK